MPSYQPGRQPAAAEATRSLKVRRVGFEQERGVLAIQTEAAYSLLRVTLEEQQQHDAAVLRSLRPLAERELAIRFLKVYPDCLCFMAREELLPAIREALAGAGIPVEASEGCAVVTVVAPNMRSIPGLMARMGEALQARAVEVYHTADSHSSVSCVIPAEQMADAAAILRSEFHLAEDAV